MSFGIPVRNGLAIGLLSSTTLSSNGGLFPAMSLDFLQPYLDSRITFSRGSNATLVDATGKITYAPANLVFNSADVSNASWNKLISGTAASATTFNFTSAFGSGFENQTAVTLSAGTNVIASFFASGSGTIQIGIVDASGAFGSTYTTVVLTSTLTRYSVSRTLVDANALLRVRNTSGVAVTGATCTQMQLEPVTYQTTPSTYVATTSAAYYGPRFDYDPVTLAAKGILIEEQRVNLLLQSQTFDTATWLKSDATVTANATTAPDGTSTADKLAETATTASHYLYQSAGSAATHTASIYAKAAERSWLIVTVNSSNTFFNISSGTVGNVPGGFTAAITDAGNGWYRCSVTATLPASGPIVFSTSTANNVTSYAGTAGSGIFLWGAQLEAGSFATSYIPTVASQVTRSADNATMTGTNFSSWYNQPQGTFVVDADGFNKPGQYSNTFFTENIQAGIGNATWRVYNGTTNGLLAGFGSAVDGVPAKTAVAYQTGASQSAGSLNGAAVVTFTNPNLTATALRIGGPRVSGETPNYLNGHIRSVQYYPVRLADFQLQALTA